MRSLFKARTGRCFVCSVFLAVVLFLARMEDVLARDLSHIKTAGAAAGQFRVSLLAQSSDDDLLVGVVRHDQAEE